MADKKISDMTVNTAAQVGVDTTYLPVIDTTATPASSQNKRMTLTEIAKAVVQYALSFVQSGTGAVSRIAQDKMREWISVKDFGAVGDGVTNDAAAIQAALNKAAISNAAPAVYLPQGVYNLGTTTLTIPASVMMFGAGRESTFINYTGTGTAISISGVTRAAVRDFRLGFGSSATMVGIAIATTTGNSVRWCKVENVEFAGGAVAGQKGITLTASGSDIATDNWFVDLSFYQVDQPITRTNSEGNFWRGIDIDTWGYSNSVSAVQGTSHAEFFQGRIAHQPSGTNCVGLTETSNDGVIEVVVDIQAANGASALNVSGARNRVLINRTLALTPLGTVANTNYLLDTSSMSVPGTLTVVGASTLAGTTASTLTVDNSSTGLNFAVSNAAGAGDKLRIQSQAAGSGPLIQASNNAGAAFSPLVVNATDLRINNKIYPGTDAGATQTAAGLYAGTGAPANANGNNGDLYFRSDGGAGTTIYQRRAGAWTGIV